MTVIRPLDDRIVVMRSEPKAVSAGGILLPDIAKEKTQEGIVIVVGQGKLLDSGLRVEPDIAVGSRILFSKYSGTEVIVDGEPLIIMRESDILVKLGKS